MSQSGRRIVVRDIEGEVSDDLLARVISLLHSLMGLDLTEGVEELLTELERVQAAR